MQADRFGRRWAMGIGCFITVIATFVQTFAPYHKLGVFIFGRVLIGLGQGIALSKLLPQDPHRTSCILIR